MLTKKRNYVEALCKEQFEKPDGCEGCPFNNAHSWCHTGHTGDLNEEQCDEIIEVFTDGSKEDLVNHPNHYTNGGMECIDEMILIFGKEATANFCLCNAWKYRRRALYKNGEEDIQKSHWYINKFRELKSMKEESEWETLW